MRRVGTPSGESVDSGALQSECPRPHAAIVLRWDRRYSAPTAPVAAAPRELMRAHCPPPMTVMLAVPLATDTGLREGVVVPSPNCPDPLEPQQYGAPLVVTPQV